MNIPLDIDDKLHENIISLRDNSSKVYLIVTAIFVSLMQAGFACLESGGSVHTKNTTNLMLMKFVNVFLCGFSYYFIGYPLAFGSEDNFHGYDYWMSISEGAHHKSMWFHSVAYAAIATAIISGAVAERCRFIGFILFTVIIAGVTVPLNFRWSQSSDGFLKKLGYTDMSGSGSIHAFSGICSFIAAWIIGPRKGRFVKGKVVDMPGHSMSMMGLGALLLVTGSLAYNRDPQIILDQKGSVGVLARAMINTILGGSGAAILSLILTRYWFTQGYWPVPFIIYATLAGLASIAAAANTMRGWEAFIIGIFACLSYSGCHYLILFIQVDDVVDSTAIHFGGGCVGIVLSPFFGDEGFLFDPKIETLMAVGANVIGLAVLISWAAITSLCIFGLLSATGLLRVKDKEESEGLDRSSHGQKAYHPNAWEWDKRLPIDNM